VPNDVEDAASATLDAAMLAEVASFGYERAVEYLATHA
jgi:hypothetical protein